jgi:hypothetical protein
MLLWSWQKPDFSLTSGSVDHSKSEYYKTVRGIPAAYAELAKRLDTQDIVWCYVRHDDYDSSSEATRVEWALDVPDELILAIVDTFVWDKIIGQKTFPSMLRSRWISEAPIQEPARSAYLEQQLNDYHSQPEPIDGWWSRLFVTDTTIEGATVLLKHPVPESCVVSVGRSQAHVRQPATAKSRKTKYRRPKI